MLKCHLSLYTRDFDIALDVLTNLKSPFYALIKWTQTIKTDNLKKKFNDFFIENISKFVKTDYVNFLGCS